MKHFNITEEEARALIHELKKTWIVPEFQQIIYKLISRLEKELES